MNETILITELNDFIFCPASIYFHKLYGNRDVMTYQNKAQINGTHAHKSIDNGTFSSEKKIMMAIDVYSEKYDLIGKIDMFDISIGLLRERKKKIVRIYDGYIFQVYAQFFALTEMGYKVNKIELYSMDDNKKYNIELPMNDVEMLKKFETTIKEMRSFSMDSFKQNNLENANIVFMNRHAIDV